MHDFKKSRIRRIKVNAVWTGRFCPSLHPQVLHLKA